MKTDLELTDQLRGLADTINRRQPRPTPKTRHAWADQLWEIADQLDVLRSIRKNKKIRPDDGRQA